MFQSCYNILGVINMFNLDDYMPDNNNPAPVSEDVASDLALSAPVCLPAVQTAVANILDSALTGLDAEEVQALYLTLQDIGSYATVQAVYDSDKSLQAVTLSPAMYIYLYLIDNDFAPSVACKTLKLSKSQPVIWSKSNKLFQATMAAIKAGQAEELESVVWFNAMHDPKASIERMFALKSRKAEYRDNAPAPAPARLDLRITLDKTDLDISGSLKDVTPEDDQ